MVIGTEQTWPPTNGEAVVRSGRVIVLAMAMSVVMLCVVAVVFGGMGSPMIVPGSAPAGPAPAAPGPTTSSPGTPGMGVMIGAMVLAALVALVVAAVVRAAIYGQARKAWDEAVDAEAREQRMAQIFMSLTVVTAAVFEGVGLLAAVAVLLTGRMEPLSLAALATAALIVLALPSRARLDAFLETVAKRR